MIKNYILHIEAHKRRLPRISFKRAPRPGDRVVSDGVPGTLKSCPTCKDGFLHEPDPRPLFPRPKATRPKRPAKPGLLVLIAEALADSSSQRRSYHAPRRAMDYNAPTHVELKVKKKKAAEHVELKVEEEQPVEHVELKVEEEQPVEHVELKLEKTESPETLELDYKLGTVDHKRGDILWTHHAEYVVDKLENDTLYLVRKDVWEARKKKAKHVELKVKDEKPGEIVELKFN